MNGASLKRAMIAPAGLAVAICGAGVPALAGEMYFKFHRKICPLAQPAPRGENRVSIPWKSPYRNAEDICRVFSLVPGKGKVSQIDPARGVTASHSCGAAAPFELLERIGVIVTNPVETNGVLVGSFPDLPAPGHRFYALASPAPIGLNDFSMPYHTTTRLAEEVCHLLGPSASGSFIHQRIACTGVTLSHCCGCAVATPILLGEAIRVFVRTTTDIIPPHL